MTTALMREAAPTSAPEALQSHFLEIMPRVETHARIYFRHLRCPGRRDDAVAETVAVAWKWFLHAAQKGKDARSFASALATLAARHVRSGRRLCGQEGAGDAMSPVAHRRRGFGVEPLAPPECYRGSLYSDPGGQGRIDAFEERLRDDAVSPVPEQAAFRIDYPAWLSRLGGRDRAVVGDMTLDLGTAELAARHSVSPGRISQLRRELHRDWRAFHGEPAAR
jgi:DNA-directed RNA polymerase specialized sigma24 family protein